MTSSTCIYCGTELTIPSDYKFEHIVPKNMGGEETYANFALVCSKCSNPKNFLSAIIDENTQYHQIYLNNISNIEKLLNIEVQDLEAQAALYRMLFSNIITAMETYLSDAFINTTMSSSIFIRKFVESDPEFKKRKLNLSEIFTTHDSIEETIKDYLLDIIYHNLHKVKKMYEFTLNVSFPDSLKDIQKAIVIRHDIVHRNGKSKKEGHDDKFNIDENLIKKYIEIVNNFIEHIDTQMKSSI